MFKRGLLVAAVCAVVSLATMMLASSAVGEELSWTKTGSYQWDTGIPDGGNVSNVSSTALPGSAKAGRFGVAFDGLSVVDSFTFEQGAVGNCRWIKTLQVYADGQYLGDITLDNIAPAPGQNRVETIHFADYFDAAVRARYITFVMTEQWFYDSVGTKLEPNDYSNVGPIGLTFTGTQVEVDCNIHLDASVVASVYPGVPSQYPWPGSVGSLVDGILYSSDNSGGFSWGRDTTPEMSVTVEYTSLQSVASVGIALYGGGQYVNCDVPKWVVISGSEEGQSETIYLDQLEPGDAWNLQYNRFNLPASFAEGTMSLTITFPDNDPDNWWSYGSTNAGMQVTGLLEFEAFTTPTPIIPEPATMSLLALGGVALLRRRGQA